MSRTLTGAPNDEKEDQLFRPRRPQAVLTTEYEAFLRWDAERRNRVQAGHGGAVEATWLASAGPRGK